MQFRDAAPTVKAAPSAGGSLLKLLVPVGAGFAVGGPVGAAVGLGAGFLLGRSGSAKTAIHPPELRSEPITPSTVPGDPTTTSTPGAGGVIAGEAVTLAKRLVAIGLEAAKAVLAAGGSVGAAAGAFGAAVQSAVTAVAPALPFAFAAGVIALSIFDMFGGDPVSFTPMWDNLTDAQKAAYTQCVGIAAAGGPACQFDLSRVAGQGTGSKQILINGEYVTIGRTAIGQAAGGTAAALTADSGDTGHWIWNSTYNRWQCKRTRDPVTGLLPPCGDEPIMDPNTAAARGVSVFGDYFGELAYVVEPGDTLTGIALKHGLCARGAGGDWSDCLAAANRIAQANGITNPDLIVAGQSLIIPDVTAKVVQTSDGPVAVPVVKKSYAIPMILGLGVLGAFLAFGRH